MPSMSDMSEITAYPTSIAESPSALPSPTSSPPPVSNSSFLSTQCHCCMQLYCTFKDTVRLKMFIFCVGLFFMYYLCEKYYKPITIQYYIANCVSWVPRLILLDLGTNLTYKCALRLELVFMKGTYCNKAVHFYFTRNCL